MALAAAGPERREEQPSASTRTRPSSQSSKYTAGPQGTRAPACVPSPTTVNWGCHTATMLGWLAIPPTPRCSVLSQA